MNSLSSLLILCVLITGLFLPDSVRAGLTTDIDSAPSNPKQEEISFLNPEDYFAHQKNHVPGMPLNRVVKTIYLSINVWQNDEGEENFQDTEDLRKRLYWIIARLNEIFSRVAEPTRPVEGISYLKESNIRFELKAIGFHQNSSLYQVGCGAGQQLNNYVFDLEPRKREYLNLHFVRGACLGASGYAQFPSGRNLEEDAFVVSFIRYEEGAEENYPFWGFVYHIAHEIGHVLDLKHPYDSEFCRFSHPDFLFDLFGFEKQEWCTNPRANCDICYHQGGWGCDLKNPDNTCTNNLMGGNQSSGSITPLQMGRMNRSLTMRNARKYAWGFSEEPYIVEGDQIWEFNKKFYQDIRIISGTSLWLKGKLEMVPEASIIIEPGAQLIIDGGLITNALYSTTPWQGVKQEKQDRKWFQILKKRVPPGGLVIENGGKLINSEF